MANRQLDEEAIFHIARGIADPMIRTGYLDQICTDDQALRERVAALLEVHEKEQDFLKSSPEPAPTVSQTPLTERTGSTIGRYRLMEQVGEGGMGIVFVAQQERPIRRKVAVKVIKPGMDSKAVVARFEAERQALAMMDHPNIAKVLDAGTTESGRPYFAMELVKGIPITEYCDRNKLTIRERLELFIQVCQAIQHAHQKGIIHRDIKPSNVLVTLHDGKPVPKVIDFGVAKALNTRLTDKTIYTEHLQIVGTLLYMSPEQAELSGLDVDTRSDVYSLGVLLYELLTGTTPFQQAELDQAGLDEQRRIIREQDPPRASNRISSLGETATTVAEHRQTDPKKLHQLVRGDLDWIVAKTLEKDRTRRFETASSLATDVQRFLCHEPIEARPPSAVYKLRKAVSRHRVALLATGVVLLSLIAGTVTSTWLAIVSIQRLNLLLDELTSVALDKAFVGNLAEAEAAIDRAERAGAPRDLIQILRGVALLINGDTQEAIRQLDAARRENPDSVKANAALFWAYWQSGSYGKMDEIRNRLRDHKWSDDDYDDLFLAMVHQATGKPERLRRMDQQLDRLVARHPHWGIAYSLRSSNTMELAMESKDLDEFQSAIDALREAERLIPRSPFIESQGLYVLSQAIDLARHEHVERHEWNDHAASLAASLESYPKRQLGLERVAKFYYTIGKEREASGIEMEVIERGVAGGPCPRWALLFSQGKTKELVEELRPLKKDIDARICMAFVLAEQPNEGKQKALKLFDEIMAEDLSLTYYCLALDIPLLVGELDAAKKAVRKIPASRRWTQWRWWDYVIDYYVDKITEDELLELAGPFGNARCFACRAIALKSMASGDRSKATKYFRLTRDTRGVSWWPYHWGKAFADRLETDETWPDWIEVTD